MDLWIIYSFVAVVGLLLGSFATACCFRIPREISLGITAKARSYCPQCEKQIPMLRNIPLLTFILQKGKTACCQKNISIRYFLIELFVPLFFLLTTFLYARQPHVLFFENKDYWELIKILYFTWSLIVICFIDLEFRIIPDRFSLGNWIIALVAAALWAEPPFVLSLLGGLFGFGAFYAMAWGYEKIKKIEGLGFGDVKMMGWLGSWIGFFGVPLLIVIASFTGLLAGLVAMRFSKEGLKTAIPFGPFLALGAYVAWASGVLGLNP